MSAESTLATACSKCKASVTLNSPVFGEFCFRGKVMNILNRDTIKEILKSINGTESIFLNTDTMERDGIVLDGCGQTQCHCG